MESMTSISHLVQFFGWAFLPPLISHYIRFSLYKVGLMIQPRIETGYTPAQVEAENSKARAHDRNIRIFLVVGYLLGTLISCYYYQSKLVNLNHYNLLGLSRSTVENESTALSKRWRNLAKIFHPDKVGKVGENFFVHLRAGYEVLEDDGKRWAYDRFGAPGLLVSSIGPERAFTRRDYFMNGITQSAIFYGSTIATILVVSVFRKEERENKFIRYGCLLLTMAIEFALIMQPHPSGILSFLLPNRITFEHIAFLRQLFISTSLAFTQLGPLFYPPPPDPHPDPIQHANNVASAELNAILPTLKQLAQFINVLGAESTAFQINELHSLIETHPDHKRQNGLSNPTERMRLQAVVAEELKAQMMDNYLAGLVQRDPVEGAALYEAFVRKRRLAEAIADGQPVSPQYQTKALPTFLPSSTNESSTSPDVYLSMDSPEPSLIPVPQVPFTTSAPASPQLELTMLHENVTSLTKANSANSSTKSNSSSSSSPEKIYSLDSLRPSILSPIISASSSSSTLSPSPAISTSPRATESVKPSNSPQDLRKSFTFTAPKPSTSSPGIPISLSSSQISYPKVSLRAPLPKPIPKPLGFFPAPSLFPAKAPASTSSTGASTSPIQAVALSPPTSPVVVTSPLFFASPPPPRRSSIASTPSPTPTTVLLPGQSPVFSFTRPLVLDEVN